MKGKNKKTDIKVSLEKEPVPSSEGFLPHREVCYEILKEHGQPMHYKAITEEVLKRSKSAGTTPQNSMFARMTTDNLSRFKKVGKGLFGLAEWDKKEVKEDAN